MRVKYGIILVITVLLSSMVLIDSGITQDPQENYEITCDTCPDLEGLTEYVMSQNFCNWIRHPVPYSGKLTLNWTFFKTTRVTRLTKGNFTVTPESDWAFEPKLPEAAARQVPWYIDPEDYLGLYKQLAGFFAVPPRTYFREGTVTIFLTIKGGVIVGAYWTNSVVID